MVLDVNIPRLETENEEDEDLMDDTSECDSVLGNVNNVVEENNIAETDKIHPIAHKLDMCMELILKYMYNCCFINGVLQVECLRSLYFDILQIFETIILPTHASQYVQYIMFYICSFKTAVVEAFVDWLWRKASDPNVPSIIRQSSVVYIASLLVAATFVTTGYVFNNVTRNTKGIHIDFIYFIFIRLIKAVQFKISKWIHDYINMQDHSNYIEDENKEHSVFYSVCEALFLIITKRHNDYPDSKKCKYIILMKQYIHLFLILLAFDIICLSVFRHVIFTRVGFSENYNL